MIHEIAPHHFDNHYRAEQAIGDEDLIFIYKENQLLMKVEDEQLTIPISSDFQLLQDTIFLFSLNHHSCFLAMDNNITFPEKMEFRDISFFRTISQKETAWLSIVGLHLFNWYSEHRFCGKCGAKTRHKNDERAIICTQCNTLFYPKISPAVIVAIISGDKLLLARNANFPASWFSLIAGYSDVGETLEETVRREVKEEVGLDVNHIRYCKSQPWPLSGSMMVGFVAEANENQPIVTDGVEITEAAWFTRHNLPNHPPAHISIAGDIIEMFAKGLL